MTKTSTSWTWPACWSILCPRSSWILNSGQATAWGSKIEGLVFCEFFNDFSNIGWWTMFRMLNTIVLHLMRPLRVMSTSIRPHSIKISEATRKLKKLSLFSNGGYEVRFVWAIIESICGLYFALLMKFLGMIGQQI